MRSKSIPETRDKTREARERKREESAIAAKVVDPYNCVSFLGRGRSPRVCAPRAPQWTVALWVFEGVVSTSNGLLRFQQEF